MSLLTLQIKDLKRMLGRLNSFSNLFAVEHHITSYVTMERSQFLMNKFGKLIFVYKKAHAKQKTPQ